VKPIVIAAGGTGGHFFPAEALAAELAARGHRIVLMTDGRSAALKSSVFAGREQHVLRGAGIAGRGIIRGARALAALAAGTVQAQRIFATIEPAAIIGFGGYPSVAPVLAARLLRHRPLIVLQEQNAVLGRANFFLSRFADYLALGVENTARVPAGTKTQFTGNPVRPAIAALRTTGYTPPTETINLLVLGGSLGARIFSDVVPEALAALPESLRTGISVTQQCRVEDLGRVRAIYRGCGITADLAPFFNDVADRLRAAHLVIGRAGASTCAELATAGRPSILVPLPTAIDDHQSANAIALAHAGGAQIIPQSNFTAAALAEILNATLTDPAALTKSAQAAHAIGRPDAAAALANLVEHHAMLTEQPA
jgi:UDP-N-acetylglucosamine--N-acetylmuramyl-(pentapeptide) pyrophosphoryl-undecaprenol N-acetylglucosamine transferase